MNVQIEHLPRNQARILVELQLNEIEREVRSAVERISLRTSFPGFRPGKAPADVVAQRVGEAAILEEALEDVVSRTYGEAIRQHGLTTLGAPHISVEKVAPGNPIAYTATVALMPKIELAPFEKLSVERKHTPVEHKDVEKTLDDLRKMAATEKIVDRPAQSGDRVELDIDVFLDKVPIDGGTTRKHPATLGDNALIHGFEEHVIGMNKGETKEFPLAFPQEYHAKHLAGKTAEFRVTLQKVAQSELPALDDAFAQRIAKVSTVAELQKRVQKDLEEERKIEEGRELEVALLQELIERSKIADVPDMLVEHEATRMMEELKRDVERRGMKFPDYLASMKKDEASFRKELLPKALQRAKSALVIRRIAEQESISVSEEEVAAELQRLRTKLNADHEPDHPDTDDWRSYLRTVLMNRKAIAILKSKASITE